MKPTFSQTCALLLLAAAVPTAVTAADIYKWTDADGNVHFEDRPSGRPSEERLSIDSDPSSSVARAAAPRPTVTRESMNEARAAARAEEISAEEQRARDKERAEKCDMFKERLQTFLTSRRLYRQDENGEREYLDEEETLAARARVQEQVVEYCSS